MNIENAEQTAYQHSYGQMGPVAPQPAPEQPKRRRKPNWFLPAGLAVAGLVLGFGAGVGAKPEPVTIEKVVEKEVEVEVIKEVTPASCIEALDVVTEAIELFTTYPAMASEAVRAAGTFDTPGLNAVTKKIETFNSDLDEITPRIGTPVSECRAAAE